MKTTESNQPAILRDSENRPLVATLFGGAFGYSGERLSSIEGGEAVLRSDYSTGEARFIRKPLERCRTFDAAGNLYPVAP